MKYRYFYQTSKNESREGLIVARDRNDAYTQLRKQGIKPYKLIGNNPLAWKRWAAIGILGVAVAVLLWQLAVKDASRPSDEEERAQLYGDPAAIQQLASEGWRKTFADAGDAWLARHAIPAATCDCGKADDAVEAEKTLALSITRLAIAETDAPELAKMKRMVNGMKREWAAYLAGGGTVEDYKALCDERLATERGIVASYKNEFDALMRRGGDIEDAWEKKNATLRSMGLPTVPMPAE